jgi:hypothetical protein
MTGAVLACLLSGVVSTPIEVRVDPRVELFTLVARLAEYDEYNMPSSRSAYSARAEKYFAPHRNHAAVKMARKLRYDVGIGFDAVTTLAVHVKDAKMLEELVPFSPLPKRVSARWTPATARAFVASLRSFVKDTNFDRFMKSERAYFAQVVGPLSRLINDNGVASKIYDFYGFRPVKPPVAIVGLLCGGGNYGVSVEYGAGVFEMLPILGASGFDSKGVPSFSESELPLVIHEFSHAFVNHLVDDYMVELSPRMRKYFPKLLQSFKAGAYGAEDAILYETFVRICVQYLMDSHFSKEVANQNLIEDRQRGFLWVGDIVPELHRYSENRARYKKLVHFFPELVKKFVQVTQYPDALYRRCPEILDIKTEWSDGGGDVELVKISVRYSMPMDVKSRGMSFDPQDIEVVEKTQFADDGMSSILVVKVKKGKSYKLQLNAQGWGYVSQSGYPVLPQVVELKRG